MTFAERFVRTARRVPTATGLVVGDLRFTYEELLRKASALRSKLDELTDREGRIAIMCPHSAEHYIGTLAAVLSGRSFVPLRPTDPEDRLVRMLEESAPSVLICDAQTKGLGRSLAAAVGRSIEIIVPDRGASAEAMPLVDGEHEAYLMYTSGSTGNPKGVPISSRNAEAVVAWAEDHYDLSESDRLAQTFEPSFDLWVFSTFVAWNAGAALIDVAPEDRLAPRTLIENEGVTVWFSTPTHARLIRQLRGLTPGAFPSLRWSWFCGEPLSMADAADWQVAAPNSQVDNLYGPTEVTQVCSIHRFPKPLQIMEPDRGAWAPIGNVFAHLDHLVADESGSPVATGEEGELWLTGSQVFAGYLGRPDEDEKAFALVEATDAKPTRYYRTGDIVRSDRRGRLRFVGRRDSQVKIMGHRIELGEIEARALSVDGVDGAVAVIFTDGDSPFGQIALTLAGSPGVSAVVGDHLKAQLPQHMQPRRIVELETVPTTPSGKIDRRALSEIARRAED